MNKSEQIDNIIENIKNMYIIGCSHKTSFFEFLSELPDKDVDLLELKLQEIRNNLWELTKHNE